MPATPRLDWSACFLRRYNLKAADILWSRRLVDGDVAVHEGKVITFCIFIYALISFGLVLRWRRDSPLCMCLRACVISVSLHCYTFPFVFHSSRKYCDHSWSRRRWWIMIGVKRAEEHGEGILSLRNPSGHQGGRWGPWWLRWKRRFSCFCTGVSSSVPLWPSVTWWYICMIEYTVYLHILYSRWLNFHDLVHHVLVSLPYLWNIPKRWKSFFSSYLKFKGRKKHTRKVYYQTKVLGCTGVASRKSLGKVELRRWRK